MLSGVATYPVLTNFCLELPSRVKPLRATEVAGVTFFLQTHLSGVFCQSFGKPIFYLVIIIAGEFYLSWRFCSLTQMKLLCGGVR